jgi:predicted permease
MQEVSRGFSTERIAVATLSLPPAQFAQPADVRGFYARLLERVRTVPGVEAASTATGILQPLVTNSGIYSFEGKPLPPPEQRVEFPVEIVSSGFFETIGAQFASGRDFGIQDHPDAPRAVIVNETLARLGWPGQDAIGRRMRAGGDNSTAPWMTVVGVIKDLHRAEVTRAIRPELYMCAQQVTPRTQMLVVRTSGDPASILPTLRREVQALNPQLPLFATGTLAAEVSETLTEPRFRAVLLAVFAAIAMLLASIGIYGVTSHAVGQRTQEVGVRMALGAQRADVLLLMLRQHLRPAVAGVVIGLAGAIALARFLQSMVFGVAATDPATFVVMGLALLTVSVAACWIPARRATKVDALIALRNQ